jgi:hypothetical protein
MKPLSKPSRVDPWSLPRAASCTRLRETRACMSKWQWEGGCDEVVLALADDLTRPKTHVVSVHFLPARRMIAVVESTIYVGD